MVYKTSLFFIILILNRILAQGCPTIVTRAQWGARAASSAILPIRPAPFVVVHHSALDSCNSLDSCSAQMRNIQNMHMDLNGWVDIGYNWCIGEDGRAYEGRGWDRLGAHAPGFSNQSMGICVLGTFTSRIPNDLARTSLQELINCGIMQGFIAPGHWIIGHRQAVNTECPGEAFFNELRTWPRFNSNPTPQ